MAVKRQPQGWQELHAYADMILEYLCIKAPLHNFAIVPVPSLTRDEGQVADLDALRE
jgi:hypothetical protein